MHLNNAPQVPMRCGTWRLQFFQRRGRGGRREIKKRITAARVLLSNF
jgi:hypothetical protein